MSESGGIYLSRHWFADFSISFKSGLLLLLCLLTLGAHRDSLLPAPATQQPVVAQPESALITPSDVGGMSSSLVPQVGEPPSLLEDNTPLPPAADESPLDPEATLTTPDTVAPLNLAPSLQSTLTPPPTNALLPVPIAPLAVPPPPAAPPPPLVQPPPTPAQTPLPTRPPPRVNPAGTTVDVVINSDASIILNGNQFTAWVMVNAGVTNPVDAAQIYLNFDPNVLQVVSLNGGLDLSEELQSGYDNPLGQVHYAAGTLATAIESPFKLLTIQFRPVAQAGPTDTTVEFAPLVDPRQTKVVSAGNNNTGNLDTLSLLIE